LSTRWCINVCWFIVAIVWQLGLFFPSCDSPFSSIYNHTTLCSHATITIFAYGISGCYYLYIILQGHYALTPPNSLVPYFNLGFYMPPTPFAIYFLVNHGATFLDNVNYVLCHLIQYRHELNKNSMGQFECYINNIVWFQ
jgi:hypothetical protein